MALITCPDCGREVSDLAKACPNCGRPVSTAASRPGILASNVASLESPEPPPRARAGLPYPLVLVAILLVVLGAAGALLLTASQQRPQPTATTAVAPGATAAPALAVNAPQTPPAGRLPVISGISCDALESTVVHIHVHLAIFVDGQEQMLPLGVGIGQPWQVEDSAEGPFVTDGSCFYWIHTHTEDGVVHIESPVRRRFTLGDFFAIWQVPLSATQVGPAQGQVITYVNGSRDDRNPADIPLVAHERIQLDIGSDVPPYLFDFPPGD